MPERKRILLIDDDFTTNTLNKLIIERSKVVDEVLVFTQAEEALVFIDSEEVKQDEKSLILLDINMPVMDGWDFLREYEKLNGKRKAYEVVMLTSSIDPHDKSKAEKHPPVVAFKSKPLSVEMIQALADKYLN